MPVPLHIGTTVPGAQIPRLKPSIIGLIPPRLKKGALLHDGLQVSAIDYLDLVPCFPSRSSQTFHKNPIGVKNWSRYIPCLLLFA